MLHNFLDINEFQYFRLLAHDQLLDLKNYDHDLQQYILYDA